MFEPYCGPVGIKKISEGKGRGVVAGRAYARGEVIERAAVLPFTEADVELVENTAAKDHYLAWGEGGAFPLGILAFMNHADEPSTDVVRDENEAFLGVGYTEVVARRDIAAGEELTFRYRRVWFDAS